MAKQYETVIGLEVHVQLKTKSKIFCSCSTEFESPPNSNICPVCCGYPGVLPVFNRKVLGLGLRVCLALNCTINKRIYFERKNYFYPDLPKGYQISQCKMPLGEKGRLKISGGKEISINRGHLEEDAGKLVHKQGYSLVDFNRCGTPLMEIVSEADISSPEEAFDYLTSLKLILQYSGASDCDMEKGSLRCDANISLREKGQSKLGTKVELKNMNSFKGVREALEYEIIRQSQALDQGQEIIQETRLWDPDRARTASMRSKEEANDYRYFPEPDLLDFTVSDELIEQEKGSVGELPGVRQERFLNQYKLNPQKAEVLISHKWLADFFEEACEAFPEPEKISNWLIGPFLEQVNTLPEKFEAVKISPQSFALIVQYFTQGRLNNLTAKKVLSLAIATDRDIDAIIDKEGLTQISNEEELGNFIHEAITGNPKAVDQYRQGKEQAIMFLVGQVMTKTRGKANPQLVRKILEERISNN